PRLPGGQWPVRRGGRLAQGTDGESGDGSLPGRQDPDRACEEGAQERRHGRHGPRLNCDILAPLAETARGSSPKGQGQRARIVRTSLKWIVLALALSPLAALAQSAVPSGRHGDGHAENHDWYKDLRQPDNGSRCCNGSVDGKRGDCRPTQSYVGADGLFRAWDGRERLVVPNDKVITMPTPDRGTHLCETYGKVVCCLTGEPQRLSAT